MELEPPTPEHVTWIVFYESTMIYFITYYTDKNHVFILNVKMNVNVTVEQQLSILMIYCSEAATEGVL